MSRQFGIWSSERGLVSATKTVLTLSYLSDVRPGTPCGQLSAAPALSWPVVLPEHLVQLDLVAHTCNLLCQSAAGGKAAPSLEPELGLSEFEDGWDSPRGTCPEAGTSEAGRCTLPSH